MNNTCEKVAWLNVAPAALVLLTSLGIKGFYLKGFFTGNIFQGDCSR
jgi:hypothetical protein